ncbi:MAG: BrnA antitoxin family protein [Spirochaeta sp.]|nr:BrnA antitoxin family protein [Spirochaeta sp.]
MRDTYDFSQARRNPYVGKLKQQITIRIDPEVIQYFKNLAEETGIKYQQLINLYLVDCARNNIKPSIAWESHDNDTIASGR